MAGQKKKKRKGGESFTLIDEAYHRLKEMIFRQNMVAGQRLVCKDLSQMFDMSRTPIINALYQLEKEGFIVSEPFRGFYVKPITVTEHEELFEIREALEIKTIELAIARQQSGDLKKLEKVAKIHASYMPPYYDRRKIALGVDFHIKIAEVARNANLLKLLTVNMQHEYMRYTVDRADPGRMQPAVDEHFRLIELIGRKDKRRSLSLIKKHIKRSKNHVLKALELEEKERTSFGVSRR